MATNPNDIERELAGLPPEKQKEVIDFIRILKSKNSKDKVFKKPTLGWMGGLKEFRDKYTSVELQKMAFDWKD